MGCLAIDPGEIKKVGWAIVDQGGALLDHGVGLPPRYCGDIVVEYPEYFRRGSPATMIRLAFRAGALAASAGTSVYAVPVSVWTRRIPKLIRQSRMLRQDPDLASLNEHVLDAVCLARWWVCRSSKEHARYRCQLFGTT